MNNALNYDYNTDEFDEENARNHVTSLDPFHNALRLPQKQLDVYLTLRDRIVTLMKDYHDHFHRNLNYKDELERKNKRNVSLILWSCGSCVGIWLLLIAGMGGQNLKGFSPFGITQNGLQSLSLGITSLIAIFGVILPAVKIAIFNTDAYSKIELKTRQLCYIDRHIEKCIGSIHSLNALSDTLDTHLNKNKIETHRITIN